jgi:hypothetical protein
MNPRKISKAVTTPPPRPPAAPPRKNSHASRPALEPIQTHNSGLHRPVVASRRPSHPIRGGFAVQHFSSSDNVRLVKELPELDLRHGQVGVVRGKWEAPFMAYEVEFQSGPRQVRVLLLENHLMAA